jgi:hypothetical protein
MAQRIKGLEVRLVITGPDGTEDGLADVKSFEAEMQMEILSQGLLGEASERKDDIFKGIRGRAELQIESTALFTFAERIKRRAQRRTPAAEVWNAIGLYELPNGERVQAVFEDIFFGAFPLATGNRDDYVTATVEFECSDWRILTS